MHNTIYRRLAVMPSSMRWTRYGKNGLDETRSESRLSDRLGRALSRLGLTPSGDENLRGKDNAITIRMIPGDEKL
jgi:hypothetical protein